MATWRGFLLPSATPRARARAISRAARGAEKWHFRLKGRIRAVASEAVPDGAADRAAPRGGTLQRVKRGVSRSVATGASAPKRYPLPQQRAGRMRSPSAEALQGTRVRQGTVFHITDMEGILGIPYPVNPTNPLILL